VTGRGCAPIAPAVDCERAPRHPADIPRFSYERFSPAAIESVRATSAFAYADNVSAEPGHLRRALDGSPSPEEWERYGSAKPGPGSVYSLFTPQLKAVLERAVELAEGSVVETAHLEAALES